MSTGIVRKIDDLGRVVIPAEMRRSLGVSEGDELEILLEGDYIAIRPRFPMVIREFTVAETTRMNISGAHVALTPGDYVVQPIVRKRCDSPLRIGRRRSSADPPASERRRRRWPP